jgi:hypothetical protein
MDYVIEVVKGDLGNIIYAGQLMLSGFFLLAVIFQYIGVMQSQGRWTGILFRLVIGFILLQNYVWMMDTTREIVEGIDAMVNPDQSFVNQYAEMSDNLRREYEENIQISITSKILNFGKNTLHNLIINLSFIFYACISKIMETIRYSIVAILFKLGPILVPLILFNNTKRVLSGWFASYVSVLAWPILWHITLAIAVSISQKIGLTGEGIEYFVALNFAVGFILIFSPMIIGSLAAGIGVGASASIAGSLASKSLTDTIKRGSRLGVSGAAGFIGGGMRSIQNSNRMMPVNSTLSQRLRNVMGSAGKVSISSVYGGMRSMADKAGYRPLNPINNSVKHIRKGMKGS